MDQTDREIPIIFIEGGIGCGKSTLVKKIQEHCERNMLKILTVQEPVDIWTTIKDNTTGKDMIQAFYENQEKYSFEFQMMAYISRLQRLQEAIQTATNKNYDIIICERSLQTDRNVFCKMLYDEGKIDEYGFQIYNKWFDYFNNFSKQSKYVYLRTHYEKCFSRVQNRKRQGEDEIPKEYLKSNNHYHDLWLLNQKHSDEILILDGNLDCIENPEIFQEHIDKIFRQFVYKL